MFKDVKNDVSYTRYNTNLHIIYTTSTYPSNPNNHLSNPPKQPPLITYLVMLVLAEGEYRSHIRYIHPIERAHHPLSRILAVVAVRGERLAPGTC